jgi:hypothetical protein
MNSTLMPSSNNSFGYPSNAVSNIAGSSVTFSQMRPRFVEKCVANNPRQVVTVDILGDMVPLPVYALRRRNAMVHF